MEYNAFGVMEILLKRLRSKVRNNIGKVVSVYCILVQFDDIGNLLINVNGRRRENKKKRSV